MLLELSWNETSYVHFSKYVTLANHVWLIKTPVFINTCATFIHTRSNNGMMESGWQHRSLSQMLDERAWEEEVVRKQS